MLWTQYAMSLSIRRLIFVRAHVHTHLFVCDAKESHFEDKFFIFVLNCTDSADNECQK